MEPGFPGAHRYLARAYAQTGLFEQATQVLNDGLVFSPEEEAKLMAALASVQALAGDIAASDVALASAKEIDASPFRLALAHAARGEADSAFAWLGQIHYGPSGFPSHMAGIRWDPRLESLRGDPRYRTLVERLERELNLRGP